MRGKTVRTSSSFVFAVWFVLNSSVAVGLSSNHCVMLHPAGR